MRGRIQGFFIIPIALFLTGPLAAAEFYLLPEIIANDDEPLLGSFIVRPGQAAGAERWELLPLELNIKKPAVIAAKTFKDLLMPILDENFILVGEKTLFIPNDIRENDRRDIPEWLDVLRETAARLSLRDGWAEISYPPESRFDPEKAEVEVYVPVLKTGGYIGKGEPLRAEQLGRTYVVAGKNADYITTLPTEHRFYASRSLSPGTVLTGGDVEKADIVRSGDRVSIVVDKYPIRLELEGISYGSGAKGDSIKVKPVRSDKTLMCRIVSSGEVVVEEL